MVPTRTMYRATSLRFPPQSLPQIWFGRSLHAGRARLFVLTLADVLVGKLGIVEAFYRLSSLPRIRPDDFMRGFGELVAAN